MYVIKAKPEDFLVEEIPHFIFQETGTYTIIKLTKKNYTTEEALHILSKLLHKPLREFSYSGNKDKKAITIQYISVRGLSEARVELLKTKLPENITIELTGFLDRPLSTGLLTGNKFVVVVRNLQNLTIETPPYLLNYYDEQRFSSRNVEVGLLLLRKRFVEAAKKITWNDVKDYLKISPNDGVGALQRLPKKILTLYIHSVQSLLWNEVVTDYLKDKYDCKEVKYAEGNLAFPKQAITNKNIPLFGVGVSIPDYVEGEYTNIVNRYGLTKEDFIIRQIPELTCMGLDRDLLVPIEEFTSKIETDELNIGMKKATLSFTLPKGSYATMVVKQLLG